VELLKYFYACFPQQPLLLPAEKQEQMRQRVERLYHDRKPQPPRGALGTWVAALSPLCEHLAHFGAYPSSELVSG